MQGTTGDGSTPPDDPSQGAVAVAMSGGVDSSVAAMLLRDEGRDIYGFTLVTGYEAHGGAVEAARTVASFLGIPHQVVDLTDRFPSLVVEPFVGEYLAGRTPNPCTRCNPLVKWGLLRAAARDAGCTLFATGHYARIGVLPGGGTAIRRGIDTTKDQSYFLWRLSPDDRASTLFPLGGMTKSEIRRIAEEQGLPVAHHAESQDICFIPDNDYRRFLVSRFPDALPPALCPGNIVSTGGDILGTHAGVAFHTIGQRRGLGIALGYPAYVVGLDTTTHRVIVGGEDALYAGASTLSDVVWAAGKPPSHTLTCTVRIRYRHAGATATVTPSQSGATVVFEKPQCAVTPGQSAVFYDGDIVIGGGIIENSL